MPYFRKKPVVIEAWQFISHADIQHAPPWLAQAITHPRDKMPEGRVGKWSNPIDGYDMLIVGTLEGDHFASPGDWIIRGVKGELYPCKPDIFEATYEAVSTPATGSRG